MLRRHFKQREAFRETASAQIKQLNAALDLAVATMDVPWGVLEKGWLVHQQHLIEIGIRPTTGNEGVLRLNIGGLPANVHRSLIAEAEGFQGSVLGALFDQMWDKRVPRDANGRIVVDESPACVKHIVHVLLKGGCTKQVTASGFCDDGSRSGVPTAAAVATDEEACLLYISHVFGLSEVIPACLDFKNKGMAVKGGSTIASPLQLPRWTCMLQDWCPGNPAGLSLLYRASRDGFSTTPFQKCVRGVCETITLIRVKSDNGGVDSSVVGGYADIELVPRRVGTGKGNRCSASAFLFLLDSSDVSGRFQSAEKWSIKKGDDICAVHWPDTTDDCAGPAFGLDDMCVTFGQGNEGARSACTLSTRGEFYDVDEQSPFLELDGKTVTEIEVFRVSEDTEVEHHPAPVATTPPGTTTSSERPTAHFLPPNGIEMEERYTKIFGASLAELLMEEQMALGYAQAELREAKVRAAAAARALAIAYGPHVAGGKADPVVELSVRGMSVTTLQSTLEACPKSVFSEWFIASGSESLGSGSGPGSGSDDDGAGAGGGGGNRSNEGLMDDEGRRKVDCDPNCFSKILDVMRMRKRASWVAANDKEETGGASDVFRAGGVGAGYAIRVPIPENERGCFKESVRMFFPGCEEFIMGLVEPWKDKSAPVDVTPPLRGKLDRMVSNTSTL